MELHQGRDRFQWMLQWGHRLSAMDTSMTTWCARSGTVFGDCFNGATAFRRWIRPGRCGSRSPKQPCFNGATAFRRWILDGPAFAPVRPVLASMGPPPFGDGYVARGSPMSQAQGVEASMGPPPFGDGYIKLEEGSEPFALASMGPPPFGDGYITRITAGPCSPACFNGATAFRRWILPHDGGEHPDFDPATLQWGHRLSAMDTELEQLGTRAELRASMGPPPFGDGYANRASCVAPSSAGFNGATAFRRWIPPSDS